MAQAHDAADIECTGADLKPKVGDQVDFCLPSNPTKPKTKSTRKRKANKESCVADGDAKGGAGETEGTGGDASENESKASN